MQVQTEGLALGESQLEHLGRYQRVGCTMKACLTFVGNYFPECYCGVHSVQKIGPVR